MHLGFTEKTELKELLDLFQKQFNVSASFKSANISIVKEDPEDDMFVGCAVVNNADYTVSGDKHLLKLGLFGNIKIVSPANFMKNYQ